MQLTELNVTLLDRNTIVIQKWTDMVEEEPAENDWPLNSPVALFAVALTVVYSFAGTAWMILDMNTIAVE